jgi:GNAT superfamily N-acetyltransferase
MTGSHGIAAHAIAHPAATGVVLRRYHGESDLPDVVAIQNAEWEADGVPERVTVADLAPWWGHASEQFDATRDVTIAELKGRPVGVTQIDWIDANDGVREYRSRCWIHPDQRRRGIGGLLLRRSEVRRHAMAATHDTERPKVLGMGTAERNSGANALARRFGYEEVRWFFDMERTLGEELTSPPPLPDGLEV